ncbi:sigma-70 family RNA polymerase sigma factor [candidate division KSB1 bacterium]|nr:sigma-70 family RNA polymerase sigma factor [candidate division KSB1 bacterium]
MDDEQLVEQFRHGQLHVFDELVLRYQDRVLNTCFRLIGNEEEARDAAQDIFIKVYHALASFKPQASFSTWLYRIAANHALNVARSRKRRSRIRSFTAEIALIADAKNPHSALEKEERAHLVREALNQLGESQKTIVVLHRFEGLSYKEIADIMNISVSSVESRLFRARQKLAKILKSSMTEYISS